MYTRVYMCMYRNVYMNVYTYARYTYVYGEDISEACSDCTYICICTCVYVRTHTCVKGSCSLSNFGCQPKTVCSNCEDASG